MKNGLWEGFDFPGEQDGEIEIFEDLTENYRTHL